MGARKQTGGKPTQKNLVDVEAPTDTDGGKHDGALATEPSIEELFPSVRQPIKLIPWKPSKFLMRGIHIFEDKRKKPIHVAKMIGASGIQLVPEEKLKEVSDPYLGDVRTDLSNILLLDPVASPAARYSIGALFEDGFELKFTLASQYDEALKRQLTPEEVQQKIATESQTYFRSLEQLDTWKSDCDVEQLAKDLHGVSLAQGKADGVIQPGILELPKGQLPVLCEILPAEDVGNPVIDAGLTRRLVAIKLELTDEEKKDTNVKDILRADEVVHYVVGIRGLRREAIYQGISPLEPVIQISKALKRIYHLDAPLALVATYITKQLIKVSKENTDDALQSRVNAFMSNLFKSSTWAMAMPDWYEGVDQVHTKVDWPMFDGIENKLATVELSSMGVPKSAMNREQDLNRDIATIQAIQFIRFTRKPAEKAVAKALETQLFNPLFAHLEGKPLKELPLRIEIVRKDPKEGDIDRMFEPLAEKKSEEMTEGDLQQNESKAVPELSMVGASGNDFVRLFNYGEKNPKSMPAVLRIIEHFAESFHKKKSKKV